MPSDEPIELGGKKTHGAAGYKNGCRCFTCRSGHARAQQKSRENIKRKEGAFVAPKPGAEPGRVEITTSQYIADLKVVGPQADMLISLAMTNARFIDTINREGRLHLMSGAQRNLLESMDRLTALGKPAARDGEEQDDFLEGLRRPQ